jgi:hypothetical protein
MGARFEKRRLLSRSEAHVLYAAERAINAADLKWRVMAQVSLGEVLSSPDARAYSAINSKRVDLLIVSRSGDPIAAIEYQGHGHYQGTAAARDAVKKEALRKAGVRYIAVTPESGTGGMAREISRIAQAEKLNAGRKIAPQGTGRLNGLTAQAHPALRGRYLARPVKHEAEQGRSLQAVERLEEQQRQGTATSPLGHCTH